MKGVCFDIGGVLVRIHRTWEDALCSVGIRNGASGFLTDFPDLQTFQTGELSEEDYLQRLQTFLHLENAELAAQVHNAILREPYAGTLELIQALNQEGVITGCLSNTNEPHWVQFENSGRFENFTSLHTKLGSHFLHAHKPDSAMYRAFEDRTGLSSREIVFFDDSEENVEGALEQGWRAHWIDFAADPAEQMELILIGEGYLSAP